MTLDGLAAMVKRGFDEMLVQFDGVDSRFDGVDNRLDMIEKKLDSTIEHVDGHEVRIEKIEEKVG